MPGELTPRGLKTCSDTNTSAAPLLFIPTAHPWGQPAKRSLNFPDPQSGPARHLRAAAAPLRPRSLCGDSPQPPPRAAVRAVRAVRTVTWPLPPAARAAAHPSATSEPARAAAALPPPRRRERAQPCRLRMRSARRGARPAAGGGGAVRGLQRRGGGCGSALSRCTGTWFLSKRRQALKMQALFLTCAFITFCLRQYVCMCL